MTDYQTAQVESFPARLMRVARDAGYTPTGCGQVGTVEALVLKFAHPTLGRDRRGVSFGKAPRHYTDGDIISALRVFAGPDNQPAAKPIQPVLTAPEADPTVVTEQWHLSAEIFNVNRAATPLTRRLGYSLGPATSIQNAVEAGFAKSSGQRVDTCAFCHEKQSIGKRTVACKCRTDMVSAVIKGQVAAGGWDTEGTRAQATRWLAAVCGNVCEGLRATTRQSRNRATDIDIGRDWRREP